MLLQNGGEIGFGHIIGKGAVAEHAGGIAGGGQFLVPGDDALGEWLHLLTGEFFGQAGQQHTAAHSMHIKPFNAALFDGYAQVEA